MKFMERRGSGLKKITDKTNALFKDEQTHVEFYSDNSYFKVIIYNANYGVEEDKTFLNFQINTEYYEVCIPKSRILV